MVDILTNKLRDYLNSNNVYWQIYNNLFIVITDSETIRLAFKIDNNKISLNTCVDKTYVFEPGIAKFTSVKLKVQNFILDNESLINQMIAISKNLNLLEEKYVKN